MQFTARLLAISAAFSQVLALPVLTNSAYDVTEGEAFDITWTNATGSVTLVLKTGISTDLSTVSTIATGLTGDSYDWTPEDIPSGTYAIAITDDSGETNYSPQFTYQGTGVASTTSTSASATSTTTTTSSGTTTSTVTSASGSTTLTSTATGASNGTSTASSTLSKSTKSSSATGTSTSSSSSSTSTSTPVNTNDSQKVGSPLALILLTAAALMICH